MLGLPLGVIERDTFGFGEDRETEGLPVEREIDALGVAARSFGRAMLAEGVRPKFGVYEPAGDWMDRAVESGRCTLGVLTLDGLRTTEGGVRPALLPVLPLKLSGRRYVVEESNGRRSDAPDGARVIDGDREPEL